MARRRLWGRRLTPETAEPDQTDPFAHAATGRAEDASPDALTSLLQAIEADALAVYREHGLPVRAGHYRRGPKSGRWTFVGARLDPEARWALALDKPPERGWRYARLEDLGLVDGRRGAAEAARLLAGCAALRNRGRDGTRPAEDLALAIRLGEEWRALRDTRALTVSARLALTAPATRRKRSP